MSPANLPPTEKPVRLLVGYFDPLHAAHTRRLREVCGEGECVIVAVDEPPFPLLPLRARQELVASLECVDFVIAASELSESMLPTDEITDERVADQSRTQALIDLVVSKHAAR